MPEILTAHFGVIQYDPSQVCEFPAGIPAFDEEREFVLIQRDATGPIVFLQSLRQADLAFITLPVTSVDPSYQTAISPDDLEILGLPAGRQPQLGSEALCLVIITVTEGGPATANLMAPIVISIATKRAIQAIQADSGYSHVHPLPGLNEEGEC